MSNYSDYYKDIENSIPMKSVETLTRWRQDYFSKFLAEHNYDRICEYGCGPGTNVDYLLKHCNNLDCFDVEETLRPYVTGITHTHTHTHARGAKRQSQFQPAS